MYSTEKQAWERLAQYNAPESFGTGFLCMAIHYEQTSATVKERMEGKIVKALIAMGRKCSHMPGPGATHDYARMIRAAFCRRMALECE